MTRSALAVAGLALVVLLASPAWSQSLVFRDGFDDAFGGPIPDPNEIATPSPGLLIWLQAEQEPNYDAVVLDERFIETIDGLPAEILTATVRFRMRPHSNANDSVRLFFVDEDGVQVGPAWSRAIDDLTPGSWGNGGPYTGVGYEFQFSLDAMPLADGTTLDMLPTMRALQYIDFYTQDDSGVDFLEITVTVPTEAADGTCPGVIAGNDVCANREDLGVAPTTIFGAAQRAGDEDWYRFTVPGNGSAIDLSIEASDPIDFELWQDDCSGTLIATGSGTDLSLARYLTSSSGSPTAYLVKVEPSSGTYNCSNLLEYVLRIEIPDVPCKIEAGTCDTDTNDGCDNAGLITDTEPISLTRARCGTIFEDGVATDYDWYHFDIVGNAKLTTWDLQTEFDYDFEIRDITAGTCPGTTTFADTGAPGSASFEVWLPVGNYAARVTTTSTLGQMDCALQTAGSYRLTLVDCIGSDVDPATSIVSVTDGLWNDPATWNPAVVPGPVNMASVRHEVRLGDSGTPDTLVLRDLIIESGGVL